MDLRQCQPASNFGCTRTQSEAVSWGLGRSSRRFEKRADSRRINHAARSRRFGYSAHRYSGYAPGQCHSNRALKGCWFKSKIELWNSNKPSSPGNKQGLFHNRGWQVKLKLNPFSTVGIYYHWHRPNLQMVLAIPNLLAASPALFYPTFPISISSWIWRSQPAPLEPLE